MHPSAGALDQLILADLSAAAEARRLAHLRGCARCREAFDDRIVLHRALAGDPERPTPSEEERMIRRALAGAQLPSTTPPSRPGLAELLVWHPALAAGTLAVCLVVAAVTLRALLPLRPPLPPPVLTAQPTVARPPAAQLATARGVRVDGRTAEKGATLQAGSTVEVDRGVAELTVSRGGTVRLFPGTSLTLEGGGEGVQLSRGKIWCLLDHNGRPFAIFTPEGEARVVGTSLIVEVRKDQATDVRVLQGSVEVEDLEHRGVVRLHAEQQTQLHSGVAPAAPRRYAPAHDRDDWDALMSDFFRTLKHIIDLK